MEWVVLFSAVAEAAAAIAAVAAVLLGIREFRHAQDGVRVARIAELQAVSMSYKVVRPWEDEERDGAGDYRYEFTLHNPGRLPISGVEVTMHYPGPVRRVRGDRGGTVEVPEKSPVMYTALVPAQGTYTWRRRLRVDRQLWQGMKDTTATIVFDSPDAGPIKVSWPKPEFEVTPQLRKQVPAANRP